MANVSNQKFTILCKDGMFEVDMYLILYGIFLTMILYIAHPDICMHRLLTILCNAHGHYRGSSLLKNQSECTKILFWQHKFLNIIH